MVFASLVAVGRSPKIQMCTWLVLQEETPTKDVETVIVLEAKPYSVFEYYYVTFVVTSIVVVLILVLMFLFLLAVLQGFQVFGSWVDDKTSASGVQGTFLYILRCF